MENTIKKYNQNIDITIIIPAYNVEKYVSQTLDSIINQSNLNFKAIIVNDGSTDNTLSICQKYADDFQDIFTIISQENKGLGAARNTGLSMVDTSYVCFIDSDDWLDIHYFKKIYHLLDTLEYEPDMIFTLPRCYDSTAHRVVDWMDKDLFHEIFVKQIDNGYEPLYVTDSPELYLLEVNANRKIYRTDFLKSIDFSFPEGIKWEDLLPHVQLVHSAKSCVGISDTGFIYRTNLSNQITSGSGAGRLDMIEVIRSILEYIRDNNFSEAEIVEIFMLITKYVKWTISMTNSKYIATLLNGFYDIFKGIPSEYLQMIKSAEYIEDSERNSCLGLIDCFRRKRYMKLTDPDVRDSSYNYWSKVGPCKSNIISSGIQCIKDSGIKYTLQLAVKKVFKR